MKNKWKVWKKEKEMKALKEEWKKEANELYKKKKNQWENEKEKEMKALKKELEKKKKKEMKEMRKEVIEKARAFYQTQMNDIQRRIRDEETRHELNLINKQKIAIYYGYLTYNRDPVRLEIPMATPVADPLPDTPPPPPPPPVVDVEERVEESKEDDPESTDWDTDDDSHQVCTRVIDNQVYLTDPIIPSDSDSDSDGDFDIESLDGQSDDDSDDEPISRLLGNPLTNSPDRHICSARCCSGTNQDTRRCVNPTTSMEKNDRGEWVGVCRLHEKAIDTAMKKYVGWTREKGHLYGWYNSRETPQQRLRDAVVKKDYRGKPRKPKTKKTRRYRGQNRELRRFR
jgi:hypothetical protein